MYIYRCSYFFSLFTISLLSLLLVRVSSAWTNYGEILENQLVDEQLRLLGPEGLLKNHRENVNHRVINDTCARDLVLYARAIEQRKSWALKMLDSSSKLPAGTLQGHVIDMGMFDECMEAHGQLTGSDENDVEIQGRHCMYEINPTLSEKVKQQFVLNPKLSICLPATCGAQDVVGLLHETINATEKLKNLGINVVSVTCTSFDQNLQHTDDPTYVACLTIAIVYIIFLVFCTICDLATRRGVASAEAGSWLTTLIRFSLLKNAEAIFNTKDCNKQQLPVIHGLRVISTCWIVLVHEYVVQLLGVNVNVVYITKWFSSWGSMYPLIGVFSVDTFLALSGFLMTLNFFRQIERTKNFNVPIYYLHRFIRLTFPIVVLFVATFVLLPGLGGSGARYEWLQNIFVTGCGSKWWSVLLYVQNWTETNNYCLLHLWSLSVDMQLYWLSPIILYPLYKKPKFGLTLLFAGIVVSALVSGSIVGANKYSSIYFSHDYNITHIMEAFQNVYQMPYTRASPWLIGILFAYLTRTSNNKITLKPNKFVISIGWTIAMASFAFCALGTRSFTHASYEYSVLREMTFAALQRPLWAFGICWIIYASIHNAAGPISSLLSAKIFLPISRLSYSIYLVHIVLPLFQVGTSRAPKYFNQYSIFLSYISDMVLAVVIAFFFSLIFEVPILILEDLIFKRKHRSVDVDQQQQQREAADRRKTK